MLSATRRDRAKVGWLAPARGASSERHGASFTVETKRLLVTDEEGNIAGSLSLFSSDERIPLKLSQGQLRALHAKCNALDRARESERGAARVSALADASSEFGRALEHFSELSANEASWLLDRLENEILGVLAER